MSDYTFAASNRHRPTNRYLDVALLKTPFSFENSRGPIIGRLKVKARLRRNVVQCSAGGDDVSVPAEDWRSVGGPGEGTVGDLDHRSALGGKKRRRREGGGTMREKVDYLARRVTATWQKD